MATRKDQPFAFETAEGRRIDLANWYRGKSAFLIVNGKSLQALDLNALRERPGIVTMGVNNGWLYYRPNLWTCVDDVTHFADVGWKDPSILKFVPVGKKAHRLRIRKKDGSFAESSFRIRQMPACLFYARNDEFNPDTFLTEPTVNWGMETHRKCPLGHKGSRSVMLAALRLLFYVGFRHVYIVGADFKMEEDAQNYVFPQDRTANSVKGNNSTFRILNDRFDATQPHFLEAGFHVHNCTPDSGLKSFPYVPYAEAVEMASAECSKVIDSAGWYEGVKHPQKGERAPRRKVRMEPPCQGDRIGQHMIVRARP